MTDESSCNHQRIVVQSKTPLPGNPRSAYAEMGLTLL